jgi:hypothetical protein
MEGSEFQNYFNNLPFLLPHFLGVYSINTMPTRMPIRTFFVTNLSEADKVGTHWIAVIKPNKGHLEIFDSLSFRPNLVLPYLKFREKLSLEYNETQIQSNDSILCGKFVVTFCVERMLNLDLSLEMLLDDIFVLNKESNENTVSDFCDNLMKLQ